MEYGIRPLCVTWKTPFRTKLGKLNLENLIKLGVNHIDFSIDPNIEKKFTLKAFKRLGSPVIPIRITRKEAIEIVIEVGEESPKNEIGKFCEYVGVSKKRFFEIAEKFRNHNIWKQDKENNWYINNYLIDNWKWHK